MKFGYNWASCFRREMFEIVDGRGRTKEPAYTISSPGAFGSGELKSLSLRPQPMIHVQVSGWFWIISVQYLSSQQR